MFRFNNNSSSSNSSNTSHHQSNDVMIYASSGEISPSKIFCNRYTATSKQAHGNTISAATTQTAQQNAYTFHLLNAKADSLFKTLNPPHPTPGALSSTLPRRTSVVKKQSPLEMMNQQQQPMMTQQLQQQRHFQHPKSAVEDMYGTSNKLVQSVKPKIPKNSLLSPVVNMAIRPPEIDFSEYMKSLLKPDLSATVPTVKPTGATVTAGSLMRYSSGSTTSNNNNEDSYTSTTSKLYVKLNTNSTHGNYTKGNNSYIHQPSSATKLSPKYSNSNNTNNLRRPQTGNAATLLSKRTIPVTVIDDFEELLSQSIVAPAQPSNTSQNNSHQHFGLFTESRSLERPSIQPKTPEKRPIVVKRIIDTAKSTSTVGAPVITTATMTTTVAVTASATTAGVIVDLLDPQLKRIRTALSEQNITKKPKDSAFTSSQADLDLDLNNIIDDEDDDDATDTQNITSASSMTGNLSHRLRPQSSSSAVTSLTHLTSKQRKGQPRVTLLRSVYEGRPSTIYFEYPDSCGKLRNTCNRTFEATAAQAAAWRLRYRMNACKRPYQCVTQSFERAGFLEYRESGKEEEWNAFWASNRLESLRSLHSNVKTNHFPGCWNLGRKDNMWMHLSKQQRSFPKDYAFIPRTYLLGADYDRLAAEMAEKPEKLWILKPVASSCGRGIKVIKRKCRVSKEKRKHYLASKYVSNPHLIDGYKYDLRIYVLVTSFDPLRVYVYEEGLARFATEKYSIRSSGKGGSSNHTHRFMHLTNYSVNKKSKAFQKAQQQQTNASSNDDIEGAEGEEDEEEEEEELNLITEEAIKEEDESGDDDDGDTGTGGSAARASKWSLSQWKQHMKKELGTDSFNQLFRRIEDVVAKTCIAVEPYMMDSQNKSASHRKNCFELYGFDILVDAKLKPWLIEVNVCPSLSSSSPMDRVIKTSLISDLCNLLGFMPYVKNMNKKSSSKSSSKFSRKKSLVRKRKPLEVADEEDENTHNNTQTISRNLREISEINLDNCADRLTVTDWEVLFESSEEMFRRGCFSRVFPPEDPLRIDEFKAFFAFPRYNNALFWHLLKSPVNFLTKVFPQISTTSS